MTAEQTEGAEEPRAGLPAEVSLVALATLLGLILRLWVAGRSQVWLDEANSVLIALAPLADLPTTLGPDSSPPLYYMLLKVWSVIAPLDPFWLRVPSLLFGAATIPALWMVGRRMDRPLTGVVAAWLLALHPLHTYYSEEIRMYSLLVLLGLGFYFALFHVLRESGAALPTFLTAAGLAYTHYYGLVFAATGFLVALVALPRQRRKAVLLSGLGTGLAFLPWLPVFLTQLNNPHHVAWIGPFWESYPRSAGVLRSLQAFLPGGMKYAFVPMQGIRLQALVAAVGLLPFVGLAFRAVGSDRKKVLSPFLLPWAMVALPLLLLAIRSHFGEPIYLVGRSDIVVLPVFLLALAMALSRLGPRVSTLFLSVWVVLSGMELAASWGSLQKAGNMEIAAAVDSAGCRTVVATGLTYAPVLFYQMVQDSGAQVVPFPIDMGDHPGNLNPQRYTSQGLATDARILAQEFPPGPETCVLVPTTTFSGPLAEAYLASGARAQAIGTFIPSLTGGSPYTLVTFRPEAGYQ